MTILDRLAEHARERVEAAKAERPLSLIRDEAEALVREDNSFRFEKAILSRVSVNKNNDGAEKREIAFICECKKASPSKGLIAPEFPYLDIAASYEAAGADCISVLTEPKWFLGSDEYLREIALAVSTPCLRKDFTVDEYMIYEAKLLGASAVLLICSILTPAQLRAYKDLADELGLSALVETHDEAEAEMAIDIGARMIGVNNRNLKDFTVDMDNSRRLREMIPDGVIFVSESGISGPSDVEAARQMGADAVLVGETLMRAEDKSLMLKKLRGL